MDKIRVTLPKGVKVTQYEILHATHEAAQELVNTLTNAMECSRRAKDYARGLRAGGILTRANVDVFTEKFMSGSGSSSKQVAGRVYTHLMKLTLDNKVALQITCTKCKDLIHVQPECVPGKPKHTAFSNYHYQYNIDIQSLRATAVKIRQMPSAGPETDLALEKLLVALTE